MTDQRVPRRPARRPSLGSVATLAMATFVVVLALLAVQLRLGRDPALGRPTPAAAPARRILERRIIDRRVIHVLPAGTQTRARPSSPVTVPPTVPPAAPAPAPAPAPLVTRTS